MQIGPCAAKSVMYVCVMYEYEYKSQCGCKRTKKQLLTITLTSSKIFVRIHRFKKQILETPCDYEVSMSMYV